MWKESTEIKYREMLNRDMEMCPDGHVWTLSCSHVWTFEFYESIHSLFTQITLCWVLIERWPNVINHIFLKVTSCMGNKQSFYHIKCQRHLCSRISWMMLGHKSIRVMWCLSDVIIGLRPTLYRFMFPSKAWLRPWKPVDYLVLAVVVWMYVCVCEGKYRELKKKSWMSC